MLKIPPLAVVCLHAVRRRVSGSKTTKSYTSKLHSSLPTALYRSLALLGASAASPTKHAKSLYAFVGFCVNDKVHSKAEEMIALEVCDATKLKNVKKLTP